MHGGLCYLTRFSESNKSYVLSVYQDEPTEIIKHFKILIDRDRDYAQIQGKSQWFENVHKLLSHYEHVRFDPAFRSIGLPYWESRYVRDTEESLRSLRLEKESLRLEEENLKRIEALQRENQALKRARKCIIL